MDTTPLECPDQTIQERLDELRRPEPSFGLIEIEGRNRRILSGLPAPSTPLHNEYPRAFIDGVCTPKSLETQKLVISNRLNFRSLMRLQRTSVHIVEAAMHYNRKTLMDIFRLFNKDDDFEIPLETLKAAQAQFLVIPNPEDHVRIFDLSGKSICKNEEMITIKRSSYDKRLNSPQDHYLIAGIGDYFWAIAQKP
jgi:hypothetical protein